MTFMDLPNIFNVSNPNDKPIVADANYYSYRGPDSIDVDKIIANAESLSREQAIYIIKITLCRLFEVEMGENFICTDSPIACYRIPEGDNTPVLEAVISDSVVMRDNKINTSGVILGNQKVYREDNTLVRWKPADINHILMNKLLYLPGEQYKPQIDDLYYYLSWTSMPEPVITVKSKHWEGNSEDHANLALGNCFGSDRALKTPENLKYFFEKFTGYKFGND